MAQTGRERTRDGGVYGSAVAAAGWQRGSAGRADLRPITDRMLDLAGIRPGHRVLDVAAGTGEQTLMAARRVGPDGIRVGDGHRRPHARLSGRGSP
jgi:predicted methyltransferase